MPSESFAIETREKQELYEITDKVNNVLAKLNVRHGVCSVFTPHSTAAIVVMEHADPGLHQDFLDALDEMVPEKKRWRHNRIGAPNATAHIKSAMVNPNITIPVDHGQLVLGQWQGIMFCEFDGPRTRAVRVKVLSENCK